MNGPRNDLLDAAKKAVNVLAAKFGPDVVKDVFPDLIDAIMANSEPADPLYSTNRIGFMASLA